MNTCGDVTWHEAGTQSPGSPEESGAGEHSGRIVTVAEPATNTLPQAPDRQQQPDCPQERTCSATPPAEKPESSREILRGQFNKSDNPEHFDRFCAIVEEVYVHSRFNCTIDQLAPKEMNQIILEQHDSLNDMAALTVDTDCGPAKSQPGQESTSNENRPTSCTTNYVHERLRGLYPWYGDNTLWRISHYLNKDCQQIKGCELKDLNDIELLSFSKAQFKIRAKQHKGKTGKQLLKAHLSEDEIVLLLSTPFTQRPTERLRSKNHATPELLYRLGTFTSNEDEMGRLKNCKLNGWSFELSRINQQRARFGPGLYTAQNATHCHKYRSKHYNLNKPMAMLEIATSGNTNLVDYKSTRQLNGQEPVCSADNQPWTIVKTAPGEFLIKDARCITSTRAFHPSMMTKVHIPYTREEILNHRLQHKRIDMGDFALLEQTKTIHSCPIADTQGVEAGIRDVLECRAYIPPELGSARGLTGHRCYEMKYYITSVKGPGLVRVKPAAPLNPSYSETAFDHAFNIDYDLLEFHVQYYRSKGGAEL